MNARATSTPLPVGVTLAWLLLAVAALAASSAFALLLVLARVAATPDGALATLFGPALVLHVNLAALVWPLALAASLWSWRAPPMRAVGSTAVGLAIASVFTLLAGAALPSTPILSNYVPLLDSPLYLAALGGFLAAVTATLLTALARPRPLPATSVPTAPVTWAAAAAALPSLVALAVLAWGLRDVDPGLPLWRRAELVAWGPGHVLQFTMVALAAAGWLWLRRDRPLPQAALRLVLALVVAPSLAAVSIVVGTEFGSAAQREAFTQLMRWGSWPGPLLLIVLLSISRPIGRRPPTQQRAVARGEALAATVSMALFVAGLAAGLFVRGDDATVPGHYHGTLGAMTLALLACAVGWRRETVRVALPVGFGTGAALLVAGFVLAGAHGAPRKSVALAADPAAVAGMSLLGAGAVILIATVLWFCGEVLRPLRRGPATLRPRVGDRRLPAALATAAATATVGALLVVAGIGRDSRGIDPDHPRQAEIRTRFDQGVLMLHARRYDHALTAFHRVLQLAPAMPEAHVNMGFALIGLGRYPQAADFFASAIELRRDQINAYYGLAVALEGEGDLRGAVGAMRAYVHRSPISDPHRRRAESALWEWETHLAQSADAAAPGSSSPAR